MRHPAAFSPLSRFLVAAVVSTLLGSVSAHAQAPQTLQPTAASAADTFTAELKQNAQELEQLRASRLHPTDVSVSSLPGPVQDAVPLDNSFVPALSFAERQTLDANNEAVAARLDAKAHAVIKNFTETLARAPYHAFVRLVNPIPNGHSVQFRLVRGDAAQVQVVALSVGATVSGDRIDVAGGVDAISIEAEGAGAPSAAPLGESREALQYVDIVRKTLSPAQRAELRASNEQQLALLATDAAAPLRAFMGQLYRTHNFVRLYNAVPRGHVADFDLVSGSRTMIGTLAGAAGLEASPSQFSVPAANGAIVATADETDGFEAITNDADAGQPI